MEKVQRLEPVMMQAMGRPGFDGICFGMLNIYQISHNYKL